jgi:hypothetical protein
LKDVEPPLRNLPSPVLEEEAWGLFSGLTRGAEFFPNGFPEFGSV